MHINPSRGLKAPMAIISISETSRCVRGIFFNSLAFNSAISLSFPRSMRVISLPPCGMECNICNTSLLVKIRVQGVEDSSVPWTPGPLTIISPLFYYYPVMFVLYLFFFEYLMTLVQDTPRHILVGFPIIDDDLQYLSGVHLL